jgi:flagellar basal-body rod modification protein FlgD
MLGVKGGTQAWSTSQQQVDFGRDNTRTMAADKQQEAFGDQNVGDVLNKIADPNWVNPAKKVRQVGDSSLDKDAFMKLLLTQMKHQDPTNPMQSHEMAAQLAQFTSLEQLQNINTNIEGLKKAQAPSHNFEALSLIGKAVAGDSAKIDRMDEADSHPISFSILQDVQKAEIKIKSADGRVVRTLELSNLKTGKNEISWNGKLDDGSTAPKGAYNVVIEAKGGDGRKINADTQFQGIISGVNFTAQGPVMMIGKQAVALKDIKEIIDPAMIKPVETTRLEVKNDKPANPKAASVKAESKEQKGQNTVAGMGGNLESVGMSQGLINSLNKQAAKAEKAGI